MIGSLRTRVRKEPIIALYFESENELKFYNLEAWRADDCPTLNAGICDFFCDFSGIRTSIATKPYIFVIFQGLGMS